MPSTARQLARRALPSLLAMLLAATAATAQSPAPAGGRAPAPILVADDRYDVVLITHASAAGLNDSRGAGEWFRACRTRIGAPASDSLTLIRAQPWDWSTGPVTDRKTLTILVSRIPRQAVLCPASPEATAASLGRGLRATGDTAHPYDAAVTSVNVRRAGRTIAPLSVERVASTRMTPRGPRTVAGAIVRITLEIDSIAPDSTGRVTDLELEIDSPESMLAHLVAIPWSALRPAWEQTVATGAAAAPIALWHEGASPAARLEARVRAGESFASAGDTAAARLLLGQAVREEPCLTLGPSIDPAARRIVDAVDRRVTRCRANLPLVLGRAAVLPGLGQVYGTRRRVVSAVVFATVAGSLLASQSVNDAAEQDYARYLRVDDPDPVIAAATAARLYDDAESKRLLGGRLVIAGTGLWVGSFLEAAFTEVRLSRRLARVQNYTLERRVGLHPVTTSDRVGLAVTFF